MTRTTLSLSIFFGICACAVSACTAGIGPVTGRDAGGGLGDAGPYDAGPRPDTGPPPPPFDAGPSRGLDTDGDGLPDADEVTRGTNPTNPDSDGDGYSDGVEVLAGTEPTSATSFIPPEDFYVILPFEDPAQLRELEFTARLGRGDVYFLVDTTGSMGLAISNVRSSLATTIVPAVNAAIADVVMGVGDFRDFPIDDYGSPGDWPYVNRQAMTTDIGAVQTALNGLAAGGGGDGPESQVEGLFRSVAGTCAAGGGAFGEACFRASSHPIIVVVTDVPSHNGPGGEENYSGVAAASYTETIAALNANDVKIVGAAVPIGFGLFMVDEASPHLRAIATATDSRSSTGAATVYPAPSGSVSAAVVDGILDLVGATTQDVTSRTLDDETDAVDARRFIQSVTPLRASRATSFDATTFFGVSGGTTITFQVSFRNDFLPHQAFVQIFQAFIEVLDTVSSTVLDRRNVYIVVPAVGGILI